jgi:hypothetical protein
MNKEQKQRICALIEKSLNSATLRNFETDDGITQGAHTYAIVNPNATGAFFISEHCISGVIS